MLDDDLFDADLGRVDFELVALSTEKRHDGGIKVAGNVESAKMRKKEVGVRFGGEIRRLGSGVRLFGRGLCLALLSCLGCLPWKPADGGHATMCECESESESTGAGDKYGIRLEPGSRTGR